MKLSGRVFARDNSKVMGEYASVLGMMRDNYDVQPIVIAGGGEIARYYISRARLVGADESTLDELGIDVSRLNAKLLACALSTGAYPHTPTTLREVNTAADSGLIVVSGGLYPGQSTNGTAALIAERVGAEMFLNATDVEGVYDSDPNTNREARLLQTINIESLRNMLVREESIAGGYDLMDIIALKVIERSAIPTRIIRASPENLIKIISGNGVVGTEILH